MKLAAALYGASLLGSASSFIPRSSFVGTVPVPAAANANANANTNANADFVVVDSNVRSGASALSMAVTGPLNCRPIGIGSAAPKTIVTNVDLEAVVETSDEWIRTRTGIGQRRLLTAPPAPASLSSEKGESEGKEEEGDDEEEEEKEEKEVVKAETIRDLSIEAAKNALDMSGIDPLDVDLVICATSSPEDMFGDAPSVATAIGADNAFAYDLTAACSGFLFASVTAGQFLHNSAGGTGGVKYAVVIGADALSRFVDWDDRNTCILFGDGAGAMVLQAGDAESEPGVLGGASHSNGKGSDDLNCRYVGVPRDVATPDGGTTVTSASYDKLYMNGREVYKFATREVPRVLTEALDAASMSVDDVDWLLLHQANIRIMETVASRLGIPMEKVITNLADYGNTSAGSIPIALDEAVRSGKVKKGDVIACAGFGAGLSWGSAIFRWGGEEEK